MTATFDLTSTYLHLGEERAATQVPVGPDFWQTLDQREDLQSGRMVMTFEYGADWEYWEMHPDGDEVVSTLSGRMTLLLETPDGVERVDLAQGQTAVVPRGTWHTADVSEPCRALFITAGRGTQHRGRRGSPAGGASTG